MAAAKLPPNEHFCTGYNVHYTSFGKRFHDLDARKLTLHYLKAGIDLVLGKFASIDFHGG